MQKADFGVYGIGVMGASLALNLADRDHEIAVYNRSAGAEAEIVANFLQKNSQYQNLQGFTEV
ncbi:MAG: NAD(P)-binding domain-containing protein, partial [Saprospiraceae bacterium]